MPFKAPICLAEEVQVAGSTPEILLMEKIIRKGSRKIQPKVRRFLLGGIGTFFRHLYTSLKIRKPTVGLEPTTG
jgi:hypothetical protein